MTAPQPTTITLHRASHVLEVGFDNGETFRLPAEYLRVHSPSAEVQGHGPGQRTLVPARRTSTSKRSSRSATMRCCCVSTTATRPEFFRGTCCTSSAAITRATGRHISTRSRRPGCSARAENAWKGRAKTLREPTGEPHAMPEEIEVDTDNLRETIDREIERAAGSLLRTIALTTALFAALAAIASLEAGGTVNEALALKTEATRLAGRGVGSVGLLPGEGPQGIGRGRAEEYLDRARQDAACAAYDRLRSVMRMIRRKAARKPRRSNTNAMRSRSEGRCADASAPLLRAIGRAVAGGDCARRDRRADAQTRGVDRVDRARRDRPRILRLRFFRVAHQPPPPPPPPPPPDEPPPPPPDEDPGAVDDDEIAPLSEEPRLS